MTSFADKLRAAARFARLVERHPDLLVEGKSFVDAGNGYADVATQKFKDLSKATATKVGDTIADLGAGKLTGDQAFNQAHADLIKAHKRAYTLGKGSMFGKAAALNADDLFYLRRAMEVEAQFLKGFIDDVVSGRIDLAGKMGAGSRADLYSRSLRGSWWNAKTEWAGGGDDGDGYEVICFWEMSPAEHCEDCVALASMSPWPRDALATVPGAGDTACQARCKCSLRYERRRIPKSRAKGKLIPMRPKAVRDVFRLPPAPGNLMHPAPLERAAVEELRQKVNYWRRVAADELAAGNEEAYRQALSARRVANGKLNEFLKDNKLYSPPAFGVDDVLSGRVLDERLVDALMSLGLDGASIASMPKAQYREIIDAIIDEAGLLDAEIKQVLVRAGK